MGVLTRTRVRTNRRLLFKQAFINQYHVFEDSDVAGLFADVD